MSRGKTQDVEVNLKTTHMSWGRRNRHDEAAVLVHCDERPTFHGKPRGIRWRQPSKVLREGKKIIKKSMKTVCSSAIQPAVTYAINRRKDLFKFARRILPATIANKNELNPEAKMSFQKVCSVINPSLPFKHACMLYARR